jgi:hypothetical protein
MGDIDTHLGNHSVRGQSKTYHKPVIKHRNFINSTAIAEANKVSHQDLYEYVTREVGMNQKDYVNAVLQHRRRPYNFVSINHYDEEYS